MKILVGDARVVQYIPGLMSWRDFNHPSDPMQRKECHFSGRVQGVGFRYTVQNIAQRYNVHGYVKNLPDGRVELIMEGPNGDMDEIVTTVSQKMNCFIKKVDLKDLPATGEFEHFYIRH